MSTLEVELSDLSGWAAMVDRAGSDTDNLAGYARTHVADGDFGRILELITDDYETLIPKFHTILDSDGSRLGATGLALHAVRKSFAETDAKVSQDFGIGARIRDDGAANGFGDVSAAWPAPAPSADGSSLPEVSFGMILDKVCDLIVWVGGPDPREYVTKWIAGDIEKAARQASAWEHAGSCVKSVELNLSSGRSAIAGTWKGVASTSSLDYINTWITALSDQSTGMDAMGGHLRDMITQSVNMAQVVVDIIKTVISMVSAALSSAYIPFWGQWKAIKTVKEAITLVNNARKVITVFWNALVMIKDGILMIAGSFGIEALPPAPTQP